MSHKRGTSLEHFTDLSAPARPSLSRWRHRRHHCTTIRQELTTVHDSVSRQLQKSLPGRRRWKTNSRSRVFLRISSRRNPVGNILDEVTPLLPTVKARPQPQLWSNGSRISCQTWNWCNWGPSTKCYATHIILAPCLLSCYKTLMLKFYQKATHFTLSVHGETTCSQLFLQLIVKNRAAYDFFHHHLFLSLSPFCRI